MPRSELAIERKNQIVDATLACISKLGYNNLSMQDVAQEAGLSKGIIHYYFENKQDLMKSVLSRVSKDTEKALLKIDDASSPVEQVRQMIKVLCSVVYNNQSTYCVSVDFWSQIHQHEIFKHILADHYGTFRLKIIDILKRGFDNGVFNGENADPEYAASMIIGLVDGISLQWLFDEKAFAFEQMVSKCETMVIKYLTA